MDEEERELYEAMGLPIPEPEEPEGGEEVQTAQGEIEPNAEVTVEVEEEPGEAAAEPIGAGDVAPPVKPTAGAEGADGANRTAVDQAYAAAFIGRVNPYTGTPINSEADYRQYMDAFREEQQNQQMEQLRAAGVDPAAIRAIVDQHPAIQQAREVVREAQNAQAKGWFNSQLREINALDPEVKAGSLDELAARDGAKYAQMLSMVGRGVSMVDAYKMLNFDALAQKRAAAAQQAVRNQTAGKAHLTNTSGQGKAGVEVPAQVREMYRDLNPDMSDDQIQQEYTKYLKDIGT